MPPIALGGKLRVFLYRHTLARLRRWRRRWYEARHLRRYGWQLAVSSAFSSPESRWHECESHEWETIEWHGSGWPWPHSRRELVMRCRNCGAPRCGCTADDPMRCCTLERHHHEAHDYLTGERIEVGA